MKHYEIEGLKFASNVYHELNARHIRTKINDILDTIAPYVLLGLVVWVAYMYQLLSAVGVIVSKITSPVIINSLH